MASKVDIKVEDLSHDPVKFIKIRDAQIMKNYYVTKTNPDDTKSIDLKLNAIDWIKTEDDLRDRTFRI